MNPNIAYRIGAMVNIVGSSFNLTFALMSINHTSFFFFAALVSFSVYMAQINIDRIEDD